MKLLSREKPVLNVQQGKSVCIVEADYYYLKAGDTGYIDGYIKDEDVMAVFIRFADQTISTIPISHLKVLRDDL